MRPISTLGLAVGILGLSWTTGAYQNYTYQSSFSLLEDRPDGCPKCPSCFNCNTESDTCTQFAGCNQYNGKCACPSGFGGDDCSEPLCGSLAEGRDRAPRPSDQQTCNCNEGWEGINCNVCTTNQACAAMMPSGQEDGAVCFREGLVVHENYQMCDVTNRKIRDQLKEQKPQVTFSCKTDPEDATCNFQCESFSLFGNLARCTNSRLQFGSIRKNLSTAHLTLAHSPTVMNTTPIRRHMNAHTSNAHAYLVGCCVVKQAQSTLESF